MRPHPGPDDWFERRAMARGALRVAGVDEAGRGPLAGPVTAAAVRFEPGRIPPGMDDSKRLGARTRERLFAEIIAVADFSVAHASVEEIDRLNIRHATHLAMRRAVAGLACAPDHLLIDGREIPADLPCMAEWIIRGDGRALSIAAASIIAKVTRDRLMVDLAQQFPGYGWETNAGYPTRGHKAAMIELGITPHHRRSFRPVHNILYQE